MGLACLQWSAVQGKSDPRGQAVAKHWEQSAADLSDSKENVRQHRHKRHENNSINQIKATIKESGDKCWPQPVN